jgi:hypothetical protein
VAAWGLLVTRVPEFSQTKELTVMDGSDAPVMIRDARGRFAAGNPGRPFGTRNRVSARVARAILADFEENQVELLVRMRRWFLPQYAAMVSRLLPRDGEGEAGLAAPVTLADLRAVLDRVEAAGGTVADLEGMLAEAGADGAGTDIIGR